MLTNPDGTALVADGLTVDAGMFLLKAQCTGQVRLPGAHIGGQLDCSEAVLTNPGRLAVDFEGAAVAKAVHMRPASLEGGLGLTRARVGAWHDEQRTWPVKQSPPAELLLEGFVYDAIDAEGATAGDRLRCWLPRNKYLPQPYEQLAGVYRREGNEQAAREVAIGKQRVRRSVVRGWRRRPSVAWSARWTIGYGYRPDLALIPLVMLTIADWKIFDVAYWTGLLHPAKTGAEQPGFHSFRYTMDLLLPVVNFKQRDAFVAEG